MNTRLLMGASALFMAVLGVAASFLPQEILARSGARAEGLGVLLIQVAGALYLGFAILNWTARANLIGGIYSRPVALGNFVHFAVAGIVLLKALMAGQRAWEVMAGAGAFSAFALGFGLVLVTHPIRAAKGER
jgi:hypothetical protein